MSDKYCTAPLKGTASGIENNADSKQAMIACLGERGDSGERPGRFTRGPTRAGKGLAAPAGTESLHGPGYLGCMTLYTLYGECHPRVMDGRREGPRASELVWACVATHCWGVGATARNTQVAWLSGWSGPTKTSQGTDVVSMMVLTSSHRSGNRA